MSIKRSYISSPALTFAILCIGLGCIVAATLKQNLAIAGLVAALPALLCILILHLRKPERFLFLLFIFNYFFTPLARYSRQDGLSVLSDIIWWSVLLIVIIQTALHYRFPWKPGRQHPHHRRCRTGSVLPYGSRQPHRVPGSMDLFQGIHLQYVSRVPNHGVAGNIL